MLRLRRLLILLFSALLDKVLCKGMVGKVAGVVGYPVTLPCDITPPTPGDSPHLILWYKNIFGTPIYSVDGRNGIAAATHWADEGVFGGRDSFFIAEEKGATMAYLNISATRPGDAGPYRCRVDFWKAATRNFKIFVELAAEVDAVNVYTEKGKLVTGRAVSSRVNGSLALTCRAYGGAPPPTLSWTVGGTQVEAAEVAEGNNEVVSVLQLKNLQFSDSGKTVACLAKNNDLYAPPRAQVKIEIILAPVRVEISRTVSTFVAGTSYNLTCQVLGSNPTPKTLLWVSGQQLLVLNERESSDGNIFTIVANFTPTPAHDGAFVSCRALNEFLPKEALEDQWRISVVYPPIAVVRAEHPAAPPNVSSVSVRVGANVIISCEAAANPKPFEFHWRHNEYSPVTSLSASSATLILTNVTAAQAGSYTCLAENLQGIGQSNPIQAIISNIVSLMKDDICLLNRTLVG